MSDFEQLGKDLAEATKALQEANNRNEVKQDSLNEEVVRKASESAADAVEKAQKLEMEIKAQDEKMKQLEAAFARAGSTGESKSEEAVKHSKAFDAYVRKGNDSLFSEIKTLSVDSDPDGGYLVTPEMSSFISKRIFETSPVRMVSRIETISTDSLDVLLDDQEASSGGWVGETATRAVTNTPQLGLINIPAHEQFAQPQATQKIIDDAAINIEQWLAEKVADKLGREENTAFVAGNGVAKPRGFTTYSAWAVAGTYESDAIEQVNSGSSGAVTGDGLKDLQGSLIENYQRNAVFMMKRATLTSIMKLKDSDGQYLFGPTGRLDSDATTAPLLGKRVILADDMPAAAADSLSVAYGDFGVGYTIVDRVGIRILRDPFTAKPFVKFYTTKRVGGGVTNFEAIKLQKLAA